MYFLQFHSLGVPLPWMPGAVATFAPLCTPLLPKSQCLFAYRQVWTVLQQVTPKSRVCHFFVKLYNAITSQTIELERCSNPLQIW